MQVRVGQPFRRMCIGLTICAATLSQTSDTTQCQETILADAVSDEGHSFFEAHRAQLRQLQVFDVRLAGWKVVDGSRDPSEPDGVFSIQARLITDPDAGFGLWASKQELPPSYVPFSRETEAALIYKAAVLHDQKLRQFMPPTRPTVADIPTSSPYRFEAFCHAPNFQGLGIMNFPISPASDEAYDRVWSTFCMPNSLRELDGVNDGKISFKLSTPDRTSIFRHSFDLKTSMIRSHELIDRRKGDATLVDRVLCQWKVLDGVCVPTNISSFQLRGLGSTDQYTVEHELNLHWERVTPLESYAEFLSLDLGKLETIEELVRFEVK